MTISFMFTSFCSSFVSEFWKTLPLSPLPCHRSSLSLSLLDSSLHLQEMTVSWLATLISDLQFSLIPEALTQLLSANNPAGYGEEAPAKNGGAEEKKSKPKKPKKPKVTVYEAASKIDASDLSVFLADVSVSYEAQQDILMRFADYFGRAFAKVSGSQFPWMKILNESSVAKMVAQDLAFLLKSWMQRLFKYMWMI